MLFRKLGILFFFGIIIFVARKIIKPEKKLHIVKRFGKYLNNNTILIILVLLAIPQQIILYIFEPSIGLINRLLMGLAFIVFRLAWGGKDVLQLSYASHEFVWLFLLSIFSYTVVGVKFLTTMILFITDLIIVLATRGFLFT